MDVGETDEDDRLVVWMIEGTRVKWTTAPKGVKRRQSGNLTAEKMASTRIGIYPGTFDPITHGHTDIIGRAARP